MGERSWEPDSGERRTAPWEERGRGSMPPGRSSAVPGPSGPSPPTPTPRVVSSASILSPETPVRQSGVIAFSRSPWVLPVSALSVPHPGKPLSWTNQGVCRHEGRLVDGQTAACGTPLAMQWLRLRLPKQGVGEPGSHLPSGLKTGT